MSADDRSWTSPDAGGDREPVDHLEWFASEQDSPGSRPAIDAGVDELSEFLSEEPRASVDVDARPSGDMDSWPRAWSAPWLSRAAGWRVGVATGLCGVGIVAALWVWRGTVSHVEPVARDTPMTASPATVVEGGATDRPPPTEPAPADRVVVQDATASLAGTAIADRTIREPHASQSPRIEPAARVASAGRDDRRTPPPPAAVPLAPVRAAPAAVPVFSSPSPDDRPGVPEPDPLPIGAAPIVSVDAVVPAVPAPDAYDLAVPDRDPRIADADAVRRTLDEYQAAYEDLDVPAAASVWPTVDRHALARAFSALESQGLTLGECEIHVAQSTATAHCRGTIRFVRKVGGPDPVTASQEWLFRMRRSGAEWRIEHVTASQTSAPMRVAEEGQ